jgi:protein TonB
MILRPVEPKPDDEIIDITFREKETPPEIKPLDYFIFDIKGDDEDLISKAINVDVEIDPWEPYDLPAKPEIPDDDIPFVNVSEKPTFMGGDMSDFAKYIQSIVVYNEDAVSMGIQGKVFAKFVVNKEGYVENIKILRGVDPLLDNEVIKALKSSPRWKPGKQRDIPVKVICTIPVVFKINY